MDESLTDKGSVDTGSQSDLPENQNNPSADEQTDSVSSDTQEPDQSENNQPEKTTGEEDSSSDEDGLAKFAKSQGFDAENLTEGERKALKLAHDNQKAYRQSQQKKTEELNKAVTDVNSVTEDDLEDVDPQDARIARLEANQRVQEQKLRASAFYEANPEAREYDKEMGEVILEEVAKYTNPEEGKMAGRFLAKDLDRLLVLAKAKRGDLSPEQARKDGAREERERLRKTQEGSADSAHASQPSQRTKKVSAADIANMSDEEYIEFRDSGELHEAINRGDLY